MFLKNRNINSKIRRSKVTDYAALKTIIRNILQNKHLKPKSGDKCFRLNKNITRKTNRKEMNLSCLLVTKALARLCKDCAIAQTHMSLGVSPVK